MRNRVSTIGEAVITNLRGAGSAAYFLVAVLRACPREKRHWYQLFNQVYQWGVLSLLLIVVAALFIGMVVGLQGYNTLQKFGVENQLGQLVALSIVRELGPVVSALLFAGRAGSALTAELGLMRVTEQLSCMEVMAVDPLRVVVFLRLLAVVLVVPCLALIFDAVAIYGGYLVAVPWLKIDAGIFWSRMQDSVLFYNDIMGGIFKSFVFGMIMAWVATYKGYTAKPTAHGVGSAATQTVVTSSVLILVLDFVLTALMPS